MEQFYFAEEIKNIVSCEGSARMERHERVDQWHRRLSLAGFQAVPTKLMAPAKQWLEQNKTFEGHTIVEDKGCLVLGWKSKPLLQLLAGSVNSQPSPIDGFSAFGKVKSEMGCGDIASKNENLIFPAAMKAAKNADATIILGGLDLSVEAESLDREYLLLPGYQSQLINQLAKIAKGPVILVIMSAGGIDISLILLLRKMRTSKLSFDSEPIH
nr:putative beta-d-xylosidase 2 [Quercus suber]